MMLIYIYIYILYIYIYIYIYIYYGCESESVSCPVMSYSLCDPMDYNLPGSSVHVILQARILEWVAIRFSRGSPQPKD